MRCIYLIQTLALTAFVLSGCASTPDPAKICTAEWIAPRADSAVERIQKRTNSSMKALRKASERLAEGKTPGPFQLLALSNAFKSLEKELTDGKGIRDLRTVAKTCNDPEIISNSVKTMLQRQGVSDTFISRIENSPFYERILKGITDSESDA